jgi:hypothetical protein
LNKAGTGYTIKVSAAGLTGGATSPFKVTTGSSASTFAVGGAFHRLVRKRPIGDMFRGGRIKDRR